MRRPASMRPNPTRSKVMRRFVTKRQTQRVARHAERGFTLLEILIAVAVLGALLIPIMNLAEGALRWTTRLETENQLKDLKAGITKAYTEDLKLAEGSTGQVLTLSGGTISQVLPADYGGNGSRVCSSNSNTFVPIGRWLAGSPSKAYLDGSGLPLCVFITPQLTTTINNVAVKYHVIAVVAAGRDGYVNPGTSLSNTTGVLTLASDDRGIVIDGKQLASDRFNLTLTRMQAIVGALNTYFFNRFMGNASRSIALDYFTAASDTTGLIPDTGGTAKGMDTLGITSALGLSTTDITDGYGQYFTLDNSSSAVRSPSNANANLQTPPFTAQVSTTLPGGTTLSMSAIGSY